MKTLDRIGLVVSVACVGLALYAVAFWLVTH